MSPELVAWLIAKGVNPGNVERVRTSDHSTLIYLKDEDGLWGHTVGGVAPQSWSNTVVIGRRRNVA